MWGQGTMEETADKALARTRSHLVAVATQNLPAARVAVALVRRERRRRAAAAGAHAAEPAAEPVRVAAPPSACRNPHKNKVEKKFRYTHWLRNGGPGS